MKEKFIQFLKDNGALEKFEANLKDKDCRFDEDDPTTIFGITSLFSEDNYIDNAFFWSDSPEQYDYWSKLDIKWQEELCKSN